MELFGHQALKKSKTKIRKVIGYHASNRPFRKEQKMQKTIKKVVAVAMALALILSMTVVASATGTTTATVAGLVMQFGDSTTPPESDMRFTVSGTSVAVSYEGSLTNYYPNTLAFCVTSGQGTITGMTGSGIDIQPTITDGNGNIIPSTSWTTGYYILSIDTSTSGSKTITISTQNQGSVTLTFTVPDFTYSTGSKIYAYLPAPGQFTNEGVTTGGWGDAYDSTGHLKDNNATGVSLGFFGGYVVYDFGQIKRSHGAYVSGGIKNNDNTLYGTDFIVFGNAFWNNSEPGCIQVSQNGSTWYDIAGCLYYTSNSVSASIIYENPNPSNDASITAAGNNLGIRAAVSYTGTNVTGSSVAVNTFHNHGWFPLNANYFSSRYSNPELSKSDTLPFVTRTLDNNITTYLELTGQRINTKATASLQYGYADVHQNLTLGGTVSYNPYATIASSSDWSSVSSNSSGGDPIDISWAVNADGSPAKLDAIRYIRVYTGTEIDNPPFGEVSTEVCGISVCSGAASGSSGTPKIKVAGTERTTVNGDIINVTSLGTSAITVEVTDVSSTANVYINGAKVSIDNTIVPTSTGTIVQVIVQDGTAAPYIAWLNLIS